MPGLGTAARVVRLAVVAALCASFATALPTLAARNRSSTCTGTPTKVLSTTSVLGVSGSYALPAKPPRTLVVIAHGYRSWSGAWQRTLVEAAAKHNAIAVAVDYRGLMSAEEYHGGWPVAAGSEDLTRAASTFTKLCPGITTTTLLSVGMGGDAAGLAIAHHPSLFTYWVDAEGATDLYGLWSSTSAFGGPCLPTGTCLPGMDTYYAVVRHDLEVAAGGPPYEAQAGFDALDAATQLRSAGSLGLKGAAVVHAVEDGSVVSAEGAETAVVLHAKSVVTDVYAVGRADGGQDKTLAGDAGDGSSDPLAGYEPDGDRGIVIRTALTALWGTLDGNGVKPSNHTYVVA